MSILITCPLSVVTCVDKLIASAMQIAFKWRHHSNTLMRSVGVEFFLIGFDALIPICDTPLARSTFALNSGFPRGSTNRSMPSFLQAFSKSF